MEEKFLKVAKQAAIEAGEIVKKYYKNELALKNKGHFANFATRADLETEQKIIQIISENFPGHQIIAEETGKNEAKSEYIWAIDPIDGTIPFIDGIPTFGISIGVLKNNKLFIGVIYMVATEELYWAQVGKGAYLNDQKISIRAEGELRNSTLAVGFGHTDRIVKYDKYFRPIIEKVRFVYGFGSAVAVLAYIANGNMDGYLIRANIWDVLAGAVLVSEAGGRVTDFEGKEIDWTKDKIYMIASNGLIHDQILEVLKA